MKLQLLFANSFLFLILWTSDNWNFDSSKYIFLYVIQICTCQQHTISINQCIHHISVRTTAMQVDVYLRNNRDLFPFHWIAMNVDCKSILLLCCNFFISKMQIAVLFGTDIQVKLCINITSEILLGEKILK